MPPCTALSRRAANLLARLYHAVLRTSLHGSTTPCCEPPCTALPRRAANLLARLYHAVLRTSIPLRFISVRGLRPIKSAPDNPVRQRPGYHPLILHGSLPSRYGIRSRNDFGELLRDGALTRAVILERQFFYHLFRVARRGIHRLHSGAVFTGNCFYQSAI